MPAGKRGRLCPLYLHPQIMEFNNQRGHFISALKQSPSTTKITHTPSLEVQHSHMHYETGSSNAGGILFDKRSMRQVDARKTAGKPHNRESGPGPVQVHG